MSSNNPSQRRMHRPRKIPEKFPDLENIKFGRLLGSGHFSHVYKGVFNKTTPIAIKIIERGSERVTQMEIELLEKLKQVQGVVQLYEVIEGENTILIFEYLKSIKENEFLSKLNPQRLKHVLRSLIKTVSIIHSLGVVHRDLKFGNFAISPDFRVVKIIDWGCGCEISDSMFPKAGSRSCRSPEMLLNFRDYSTGCDTWAIGVFILNILTMRELPWKTNSNEGNVPAMSRYLPGIHSLVHSFSHMELSDEYFNGLLEEPVETLESTFASEMRKFATPELVDLMNKFLTVDYRKRISCADALKHVYFSH